MPHCVSHSNATVSFVRPGPSGGTAHVRPGRQLAGLGPIQMRCVVGGDELAALGHSTRRIDLLSLDVEGSEASVLRCFPFARHKPRAVLVETDKMGDLRDVDRFFHRKGYANRETFVARSRGARPQWADNLYVPVGGPPTVYPPTQTSELHCELPDEKRFRGAWCQPWSAWSPAGNKMLRGCEAPQEEGW